MELDGEKAPREAAETSGVVESEFEGIFMAGGLQAQEFGETQASVGPGQVEGSVGCATRQVESAAKQWCDEHLKFAEVGLAQKADGEVVLEEREDERFCYRESIA